MRETSLRCVHELAKRDERVVFLGSDLGAETLKDMRREMPERFFMEGVSEAALVGMAAGLALEGRIPYFNTIGTFITRRCFEQVVDDLCLHRLPVRLIGSGGGLVYAPLGPTHQAIEDLAIFRALPHMTIIAPADAVEMRRFMEASLDVPGPIYVRLGKGGDPVVTPDVPFVIGRGVPLREGNDALLVTTGIMAKACLDAAARLATRGIRAGVLHLPTVKPLDVEAILSRAAKARAIVSVEEHTVIGGLGGAVAEVIAEGGLVGAKRFARMGIPDVFCDRYGSQAGLLERFGLTEAKIAERVLSLLER